MAHDNSQHEFLRGKQVSKILLLASLLFTIIYTGYIAFLSPSGNKLIFILLLITQIFFAIQSLSFIFTVWNMRHEAPKDESYQPGVDVFITVCGEPVEVVEQTLLAALSMDYPDFNVYILNDGYVAKRDNWQEMEDLARRHGAQCITRTTPGGAKAGNINNALKLTTNPFVAIFDADHVPHRDFLQKTMGYFVDRNMAFVQTPQYYKNNSHNFIAETSWDQQALFFGPLCRGKNRLNSVFMCGTNMVIRKTALLEAGGMYEKNIAEDFLTSLFIHNSGWKSTYVPEVLAEGLAPEDFLSYYKQQFRWTRGSLEVIFRHNPLFSKKLTWAQKLQYLGSASYYLTGFVVLINILLPVLYFFTGQVPLNITTMQLALIFFPYLFLNVYILQQVSGFTYTFKALSFSVSSFLLQIQALVAVLLNVNTKFSVTSKTRIRGNFLRLVAAHITYVLLVIIGFIYAFIREGLSASLINNAAWAALFVVVFSYFIYAAAPEFNFKLGVKSVRPDSDLGFDVQTA